MPQSAPGISCQLGLYRETVAGTMPYPTEARPVTSDSASLKLWRSLENHGKTKDSTSIMDLELFMPSQDTVWVEAIMPSRKLQDASPKDQLRQLSNCLGGFVCKTPPLHKNASRRHPYLLGLPNAEPFAGPRGTCVSLYSRSVLH